MIIHKRRHIVHVVVNDYPAIFSSVVLGDLLRRKQRHRLTDLRVTEGENQPLN